MVRCPAHGQRRRDRAPDLQHAGGVQPRRSARPVAREDSREVPAASRIHHHQPAEILRRHRPAAIAKGLEDGLSRPRTAKGDGDLVQGGRRAHDRRGQCQFRSAPAGDRPAPGALLSRTDLAAERLDLRRMARRDLARNQQHLRLRITEQCAPRAGQVRRRQGQQHNQHRGPVQVVDAVCQRDPVPVAPESCASAVLAPVRVVLLHHHPQQRRRWHQPGPVQRGPLVRLCTDA